MKSKIDSLNIIKVPPTRFSIKIIFIIGEKLCMNVFEFGE